MTVKEWCNHWGDGKPAVAVAVSDLYSTRDQCSEYILSHETDLVSKQLPDETDLVSKQFLSHETDLVSKQLPDKTDLVSKQFLS